MGHGIAARTALPLAHLACSSADEPGSPPVLLTAAELLDPASCAPCHAGHVRDWASSMHAHASKDPVFLAMNRRGQEETNGQLGDFCVQCHAPVARAEGLTTDGLNLESLPDAVQGVTCHYCHSVADVTRDHNNGLVLADDGVLRGPIESPAPGAPHRAEYSPRHDLERAESSALCGSCHDVVLQNGVPLERTAAEWRGSGFSVENGASRQREAGCVRCHMPESGEFPTAPGTGRRGHEHHFAAVDVDLTEAGDAPPASEHRALVQSLLDTSLGVEICVQRMSGDTAAVQVSLENLFAGHDFPSGASHDRRVWVHVRAEDAAGKELYASGATAPDEGPADADLWVLHDEALKANDEPAHLFWEVASLVEHAIPVPVTFDLTSRDAFVNVVTRRFPRSRARTIAGGVARVTVTAKVRPIGYDVLDDLVRSGHLDPSVRDRMPLFELVPNRRSNDPSLESLRDVTFEWSEAARESGRFSRRILNDEAFPKECLSTTPP